MEMSSRSGPGEITLASPTEQQANAPVATAMDAKLMVATGSGDVQQLKDLVSNQEQDSKMMVVVMAKQQAPAASAGNPRPHPLLENMDPRLLALASSGSSEKLRALLNGQASANGDTEANKSILERVTAEGDTALHVVAACGQGDNFFTRCREAKHLLVQQNHKWWRCRCLTNAERDKLLTTYGYGDGDNFLESARIIYKKAKHLLFMQNNNGDTPLHCAARAGKSKMVACLIDLVPAEGEGTRVMKELLRKENKHKETALNEAVRVGNMDIVNLLMGKDSELASFPRDGSAASPMYLAIVLKEDEIVKTLYVKTTNHGKNFFSGPNGQNALHAAVLRHRDLTKLLIEWNKIHLRPQNEDLTLQMDENGSTPLHFAAAARNKSSDICRQVLEANSDALYQPDTAGFFPIHVAASVGASSNVDMFVKKCPVSAGLRDGKGRSFLHVAVEKKKMNVIRYACRNLSLSWIINMVDNDGNTALHLAVKDGSLKGLCLLLENRQVNLNLPNNRGETPLDIAEYKNPQGGLLFSYQRIEAQICSALTTVGAVKGVCRQDDLLEDNKIVGVKAHDKSSKEMEVLKDSTGTLCIGAVLIATVTFGATFAVPGGYIADDHKNGGSPILARRYAFHAFMWSNTMAFILSMLATVYLMQSGNPVFNLWSRREHLNLASIFVSHSISCLAATFGLAAYVVLAPVALFTATVICIFTFKYILIYSRVEFLQTRVLLLTPLCSRKGRIRGFIVSAYAIMGATVLSFSPLITIFCLAYLTNESTKIEAPILAPAPAPAPLAST